MKLIFATANKGKLREAREILGPGYEIISPADLGIFEDIEETGSTFRENSIIKAEYISKRTGMDCFADDSGLMVDALDGAPGVYSARYAGEGHDFDANIAKLLNELGDTPERTARFRCVVTLILNGEKHFFEGNCEGRIAYAKSGSGGFGYDPVFIADAYPDRSLAEIGEEEKNTVSHRGESLRAMAEWIKHKVLSAPTGNEC